MNSAPSPAERRLRLAYLILCLAYMGWALWAVMVPEHKRTECRLRLLRSCGLVMSRLALRTGEASMQAELDTGVQAYGVPYRLSVCRVALERAYDRARNATL
jgi:hypothetical protein